MQPRSIRLFLADGSPTGLRTAEIALSTCKAVACPRSSLAELKKRAEVRRTGVYILIGEELPDQPGRTAVYVGQGDDVLTRILQQDVQKAFWDRVLIFVCKDETLTRAHVRFLESALVRLALRRGGAIVTNQAPEGDTPLAEADAAEMNQFIGEVRLLLGVFGITLFEPAGARLGRGSPTSAAAYADPEPEPEPGLVFHLRIGELLARGVPDDDGFIVLAGSQARPGVRKSIDPYYTSLRSELVNLGILRPGDDGALRFTQSHSFKSPSGAAAVITGSSINGRISWKLEDGTTLKDWQDRGIND